jgi:hypothetical protein
MMKQMSNIEHYMMRNVVNITSLSCDDSEV